MGLPPGTIRPPGKPYRHQQKPPSTRQTISKTPKHICAAANRQRPPLLWYKIRFIAVEVLRGELAEAHQANQPGGRPEHVGSRNGRQNFFSSRKPCTSVRRDTEIGSSKPSRRDHEPALPGAGVKVRLWEEMSANCKWWQPSSGKLRIQYGRGTGSP